MRENFGPTMPIGREKNSIATVEGPGRFPTFASVAQPLCDKTWALPDTKKAY